MSAPTKKAVDLIKRMVPPPDEITRIPKAAQQDIALYLSERYSASEVIHELCQRLEVAEGKKEVRGGR